ncbi:hypothetical protein L1887_22935 [Cichorium endivia]|nr:hypothetical protein L1887_22935 [Cichorium endivia]
MCTKTNIVMVFGEITTTSNIDYKKIVRTTCKEIGFTSLDVRLDSDNCKVLENTEQESPDIAQCIHGHLSKKPEEISGTPPMKPLNSCPPPMSSPPNSVIN